MLAVLIATGSVSLFATEADQFRLLSTLPQEHVQSFAAAGEIVYALSPGNLTVLDASTPGQDFAIVTAIPVEKKLLRSQPPVGHWRWRPEVGKWNFMSGSDET